MKLLKKLLTPAVILFFLAFLVRVGFLVYQFKFSGDFQSSPYFPTSDRRDYDSIAMSLLEGYGFKSTAMLFTHTPPFYPFFLAFLYSFFGHSYHSYLAVFLVQAFLSSLVVVFIFLIGKKVFNPLTGLIAALIACFYFPFITGIGDLELENLLIFMPLLFVFYLLKIGPKSGLGIKVITGIIMGLTILTKSVFLLTLPILTFLWLRLVSTGKYFWKTIFIVYLTAGLIFSSWLIRNFLIDKKFLYSSQQGIVLFAATHPEFKAYNRQEQRLFMWELPQLNEAEKNNHYTNVAIKNLKKNPYFYLKRVLNNWLLLFEIDTFPNFLHLFSFIAIIGFIFSFLKKKSRAMLLFLFFFLICAQYLLILGLSRFRIPFDWILMLFASFGLIELVKAGQQIVTPKSNLLARIKQFESLIDNIKIPNELVNKIKTTGVIIFLTFLGIFLARIVPRYLSKKTIPYPEINSQSIEKILTTHNLSQQWKLQENKQLNYADVLEYQKNHQGNIDPFLGSLVVWQGEANYVNLNTVYPLGSAKHPKESLDPEYKGFYDMYYLLSQNYSTFNLVINRGIKPHYYGDGIATVNYQGSLLNKLKNDDKISVLGKIIGQNVIGHIYLEGYEVIF